MKKTLLLLCACVMTTMWSHAQDTNVALNATATASIGNNTNTPASMVDGNSTTVWQGNGEGTDGLTITLDLGSSKTFNAFSIAFQGNRFVSKFSLSVSTDNENWTPLGEYTTGITNDNQNQTVSGEFASAQTARYVKYTSALTDKNEADQWSETISEFQLISYNSEGGPATHNDIFYSIFTKSRPSTSWSAAWNGGATQGVLETYNGVPVQTWENVKCLFFGYPSWEQGISVATFDKLHLDIYAAEATNDYKINFEIGSKEQALSLKAGWNEVELDFSSETGSFGKAAIRHNSGNSEEYTGATLKLANIYFTELTVDESAYEISTLTATPKFLTKNEATVITFSPLNASGVDLSNYPDNVTVAYAITAGTGTLSGTTLTIEGDTPVTVTATATKTSSSTTTTASTTFYLAPTEPTEPSDDAGNVIAIYSSTYNRITAEGNPTWGGGPNPLWTSAEAETMGSGSHQSIHVKGTGWGNRPATKPSSDYVKVNVAVYPTTATTIKIYGDNAYASAVSTTVVPGQWNYVSIPATLTQEYMAVELVGETEFFLDHFYVAKAAADELVIGSADAKGIAAVTGTITTDNKDQVEAMDAKVIDLRGATLGEGVTGFTLKTNQLLLVKAESADNENRASAMAEALTGNTNNVIVKNDGQEWYYAMKPIVYTDQNDRQPVSFSINMNGQTYTITRSIPAGKYVSAAVMAATTAPEGISVYEFTGYTNGVVSFTKKADQNMVAKTPYVLYNTTAEAIDLVTTATGGDLNPTVDAGTVTLTGTDARFVANLTELTTNGSQYILSNGNFHKANGATVGAYRAYLTGVSAPTGANGVKVFFDDVETSIEAIDSDENGKAINGTCFDLSGRRVSNPTKGIYVVNGKKVVLK